MRLSKVEEKNEKKKTWEKKNWFFVLSFILCKETKKFWIEKMKKEEKNAKNFFLYLLFFDSN